MEKSNIFMTGYWKDLIISTFEIEKEILEAYLPNNTEIDLYNGKALMSIVAFTFSNVKFFGVKIPFHQNFGQINFRFYVKSKINNVKGVVFIKEFAPKPLVASIANLFYNEPFFYKNIKLNKTIHKDKKNIKYSYKNMVIEANTNKSTQPLIKNSFEDFVVDRYTAFIKSNKQKTFQYKINHNPWRLYNSIYTHVDNNILSLLPKQFKTAKHIKTCVVDGSYVSVEKGILQKLQKLELI